MINGIRLKVCGLTSLVDAALADRLGADYLGFVLYPQSPRHLTVAQFRALAANLPDRKKVAVAVEPTMAELKEVASAGFDFVQIHFRVDIPPGTVAAWSEKVGPDHLWLAPKLPPDADIPAVLLPLAETFLFDAFQADMFGGSGRTADWTRFRRHREEYPDRDWILAGGLNPDNVTVALEATGARFVDVNSGVEASPGVKDQAKLSAFVACLAEFRTG
jgi:phosphoribosylanthranilate isomerase